jgi:glycosyltransferase involved in cell wall biosynthesis
MSGHSKVAVVIPCFNHGEYLPEAVASVEKLCRRDVEAIVVDDGSTENRTHEEVARLCQRGVRIIRQENRGLAAARNAGIAATNAEYIFPLDADDRMLGGWLERGIQVLDQDARIGVVYGDAACFGARTYVWKTGPFRKEEMLGGNFIHASALYRRVIWEEYGGYDGTMPVQGFEDWDLWIGAFERGWRFHYLAEVLFEYRQHEKSMLTHGLTFIEQVREFVVRKHYLLYGREYVELLYERRALVAERQSVKATSRHLGRLLRSRLKRRLGIVERDEGPGETNGAR